MRQGNTIFQNLNYSYDKVGNILGLANNVAVPPPNVFGGPTSQTFVYDDLYREYVRLHDVFGRDGESVMKTLRKIRHRSGEEVGIA